MKGMLLGRSMGRRSVSEYGEAGSGWLHRVKGELNEGPIALADDTDTCSGKHRDWQGLYGQRPYSEGSDNRWGPLLDKLPDPCLDGVTVYGSLHHKVNGIIAGIRSQGLFAATIIVLQTLGLGQPRGLGHLHSRRSSE